MLFRTLPFGRITLGLCALLSLVFAAEFGPGVQADATPAVSYILQGESAEAVADAVIDVDGDITHELGVIRAVAANLTAAQLEAIRNDSRVTHVHGNTQVETAGKPDKSGGGGGGGGGDGGSTDSYIETYYPTLIGANLLHQQGIDGWGIGIAIIDTGMFSHDGLTTSRYGNLRRKVQYDAITNEVTTYKNTNGSQIADPSGHGSHVASIAVSSKDFEGSYNGIAPGANIIPVTALNDFGQGSYADVIRGIDWIVANHNKHGIDIINMSLSAPARSHYWEDPLNQAVMAAWEAGIVVVASAGNTGPAAQTIGVPGNVPYVITVGAMTDNYTPADGSDDRLATFSATGPTYEGFVKPEIVAPGGHMLGLMQKSSELAMVFPQYHDGTKYFEMSGTSQSTAVVSGVVALALQMEPGLTPDQVKCKVISAARPAVKPDGTLAYSVFQQGAGMVNAYDAVYNWNYNCANNGLDITADLNGTAHFGGRANQNPDGSYYLMGLDGYAWTDSGANTNGYAWTDNYFWADGYGWTDGLLQTDGVGVGGYLWTDGYAWTNGYAWTDGYAWIDGYGWTDLLTESMSINTWVDPE